MIVALHVTIMQRVQEKDRNPQILVVEIDEFFIQATKGVAMYYNEMYHRTAFQSRYSSNFLSSFVLNKEKP